MRTILFLAFISSLYACSSACTCKSGEANASAVSDIYSAFAEGNMDAVLASMSPDIQWNEAENFIYADGNPYVGPDAVVNGVFARLGGDWDYWNLEEISVNPVGASQVLATGRYKAKNKASGKELDAQFAHLWTIAEGKATHFQQYTDTKQAAEAIIVDVTDESESEGTNQ
jgi:ketosteroid isomerase-like protein